MTKTFTYSAENNEFIGVAQKNYFLEEYNYKTYFYYDDKKEFREFVNLDEFKNEKNKLTK